MNVVNMILHTMSLLISSFFFCGSGGDETVQFAQRGACTEASIVPSQRGEGRSTVEPLSTSVTAERDAALHICTLIVRVCSGNYN